MSLYYPELTGLHQPLSGEYAGRRTVLEQIPFVQGWGVEIAMLIDVARRYGPEAIAQVDLGTREHRHRSLHALSVQAAEVMATMLARVPDGSLLRTIRARAAPRRRLGGAAQPVRAATAGLAHTVIVRLTVQPASLLPVAVASCWSTPSRNTLSLSSEVRAEVADAALVAARRVHGLALGLGQRDLRRGDACRRRPARRRRSGTPRSGCAASGRRSSRARSSGR